MKLTYRRGLVCMLPAVLGLLIGILARAIVFFFPNDNTGPVGEYNTSGKIGGGRYHHQTRRADSGIMTFDVPDAGDAAAGSGTLAYKHQPCGGDRRMVDRREPCESRVCSYS